MKVQIIYSSLSGCTRKVAEGIYHSLTGVDKSIHDLKDGEPVLDGDILLLGYWVNKGGPNEQMHAFLEKLKGKTVGIFCTLAFYADSEHGYQSLKKGVDLAAQKNTVIGSFVRADACPLSYRQGWRTSCSIPGKRASLEDDEHPSYSGRDFSGSRALWRADSAVPRVYREWIEVCINSVKDSVSVFCSGNF